MFKLKPRARQIAQAIILVIIVAIGVDMGVSCLRYVSLVDWVGWMDLDIQFIVTDADTGQRVANARIEIDEDNIGRPNQGNSISRALRAGEIVGACALESCGPFLAVELLHRDERLDSFQIPTDTQGVANVRCFRCMAGGLDDMFRHTWSIALPDWRFRVSAPGYEPTHELSLRNRYGGQAQLGAKAAKLTVSVHLRRWN
jgi:hypothetical protein